MTYPGRHGKRAVRPRRERGLGNTYRETRELVRRQMSLEEIANSRGLALATVLAHVEKLISAGEEIDIEYLRPPVDKMVRIKDAFQKSGGMSLAPVKGILGEDFSYEEIRVARLFL